MTALDITKADLPMDWTGWTVHITHVNHQENPPVTEELRGPMKSWMESGTTLQIDCETLEKLAEDGSWESFSPSRYQTFVLRFTLTQDSDTRIIMFKSIQFDELFTFTPPETPPD